MTTWEEPCYTTDTVSRLARCAPREQAAYQWLVKKFPIKIDTLEGLPFKKHDDIKTRFGFTDLFPNTSSSANRYMFSSIQTIVNRAKRLYYGMDAVMRFMNLSKYLHPVEEIKFQQVNDYVDSSSLYDQYISLMSPGKIQPNINAMKMPKSIKDDYERLMNISYAMNHAGYYWRSASEAESVRYAKINDRPWPYIKSGIFFNDKEVKLFSFPSTVILEYTSNRESECETYVLEPRTLRRVAQTLRSLAKLNFYFSAKSNLEHNSMIYTTYKKLEAMLINSAQTKRVNEIARAWDVIFYIMLAGYARDVWDVSYNEQLKKYDENRFSQIIRYSDPINLVSSYSLAEKMEFLKIYKILPCPDFDPFTGFLKMKEFHENPHPYGLVSDKFRDLNVPYSLDDFHNFQKLQFCRRYFRRHKMFPGTLNQDGLNYVRENYNSTLATYPNLNYELLKLADCVYIDFKSSLIWDELDNNNAEEYSDKGCAPPDYDLSKVRDSYDFQKLPDGQKNYLLWFLECEKIPDNHFIRNQFATNNYLKQQTAHFKPENKKPDPRNFYSATPYMRRIETEWERNISPYAASDVHCLIGKNTEEKQSIMKHVLGTTEEKRRYRIIHISFDIEKWSPRFNPQAKEDSYRLWIESFNAGNVDASKNLSIKPDLHFIHEGIHQNYKPECVDLEGQAGKTNTLFHIDIMAYAVRMLRQMHLYERSGRLTVHIDDGLLSLIFDKDTTNESIRQAIRVIDATYDYLGFTISWDKTFVSEHVCQYLNEVYYKGVMIQSGMKAFLKLQTTKFADEPSVLGKVKALTAMAAGCVKAGVNPLIAKYELYREIAILYQKSNRRKGYYGFMSPEEFALFVHTPISHGGIGIPTVESLTIAPTPYPLAKFTGLAQYLIRTQPRLKNVVAAILTQAIRPQKAVETLRDPLSIKISGRTLTELKHLKYVLDVVRLRAKNLALTTILATDAEVEANAILDSLVDEAEIAEINIAYKLSSTKKQDSFLASFKRSTTLIRLATLKTKNLIFARYMTEFQAVANQFHALYVRTFH